MTFERHGVLNHKWLDSLYKFVQINNEENNQSSVLLVKLDTELS